MFLSSVFFYNINLKYLNFRIKIFFLLKPNLKNMFAEHLS